MWKRLLRKSSSRETFLLLFAADVALVAAPDELLPLVELHRGVGEHQHVAEEQDAQGAGMVHMRWRQQVNKCKVRHWLLQGSSGLTSRQYSTAGELQCTCKYRSPSTLSIAILRIQRMIVGSCCHAPPLASKGLKYFLVHLAKFPRRRSVKSFFKI